MAKFYIFLVAFLCVIATNTVTSIHLDKDTLEFLKSLLEEFDKDPQNKKFATVIEYQGEKGLKLPKVLIWCPMKHFKMQCLLCPVHNQPLKVGDWVEIENAVLVYDIASNILLVQRYYTCDRELTGSEGQDGGHPGGHRYLSAASEIMSTLPQAMQNSLPAKIHYQFPLSTQLLDFIIVELNQGYSFEDVRMSLSSLNIQEFVHNCQIVNRNASDSSAMEVLEKYRDSLLYSQPKEEDLIQVFLAYMNDISLLLQEEMNKRVGRILTCDNTFKLTSKNQESTEEEKAASQCEGIFLGTNENKEIVFWRMVDLLSFNEMQEVLIEYAERLRKCGENLQMVIVDDCCQVRTMYEEIFGNKVKVKLNLLQASQHVISKLPKGAQCTQQIVSDFKQVFRATGDAGEERIQTTPSIEEMSANLELFLGRWRNFLNSDALEAVQIVQGHIANGCLSGIPAGCGTENNENLQDYLKKHIISNVTIASPELTVAVLAFALYAWNCHKKHSKILRSAILSKIQPAIPVELLNMVSPAAHVMKCSGIKMSIVEILQSIMETDSEAIVRSYKTDATVKYMVMRILDLHEFLLQIRKKCKDQGDSILRYLAFNKYFARLARSNDASDEVSSIKNQETLTKNLSTYGLKVEKVIGDGNCCFRSIITQIHKLTNKAENSSYTDFLKSLGLTASIDEDIQCLRALFVQEISSKAEKYKRWVGLSEERLNEELAKFAENGFYESDLGDFCVKVCSDILQIPIVLVTSYSNAPQVPFVPETVTLCEPIILAFDHTAPGHYDGTSEENVSFTSPDEPGNKKKLKCSCGRRSKDIDGDHCKPDLTNGKVSKCACVKAGKTCSKYCSCLRCMNDKRNILTDEDIIVTHTLKRKKPCRCGKKGVYGACRDSEIRRCKCPCFRAGLGCISECSCFGCANIFNDGTKEEKVEEPGRKKYRKRKHPAVEDEDISKVKEEEKVCQWSDLEILAVLVAMEVMEFVSIPITHENVHELYSFLISSLLVNEMELHLSEKSPIQIEAKMLELQQETCSIATKTVSEALQGRTEEQVLVTLPDMCAEAQIILLLSESPCVNPAVAQDVSAAATPMVAATEGGKEQHTINGNSIEQVLEEGNVIVHVGDSPIIEGAVIADSNMTEIVQDSGSVHEGTEVIAEKELVVANSSAEESAGVISLPVTTMEV